MKNGTTQACPVALFKKTFCSLPLFLKHFLADVVVQITFVTIDYQAIKWNHFWFSKETSSEQFSKEPISEPFFHYKELVVL